MLRRRRPQPRETPFSLDSFLDLVTNVVGIIIRLIIVAWIGGRTYNSLPERLKRLSPEPAAPVSVEVKPLADNTSDTVPDPLEQEMARQQQELAEAEARLVEQLEQLGLLEQQRQQAEKQAHELAAYRQRIDSTRKDAEQTRAAQGKGTRDVVLALAELQKRRAQLDRELRALEKQPTTRKVHRYHTPVSETVRGEQTHFECREGRVTYINMAALLPQIVRNLRNKEELLRSQWQIEEVTEPVGAFKLRYVIERHKSGLDSAFGAASPEAYSNFSYGVSVWQAEPVAPLRGEPAERALAPGSDFRRVADGLPADAAITFFVYPDSFPLYRKLRDYLAERNTVAAFPLPSGTPITWSSSRGWLSRGQ